MRKTGKPLIKGLVDKEVNAGKVKNGERWTKVLGYVAARHDPVAERLFLHAMKDAKTKFARALGRLETDEVANYFTRIAQDQLAQNQVGFLGKLYELTPETRPRR